LDKFISRFNFNYILVTQWDVLQAKRVANPRIHRKCQSQKSQLPRLVRFRNKLTLKTRAKTNLQS
jgi:hypothetical protein